MMTTLLTLQDLDAAFTASESHPVVLYKHSATCPFAARAQEQVAEAKHEVSAYVVVVQYGKDISVAIAERTGVEHASPQAIVLDKGKAVWHGWRAEITKEKLVELAGQGQEA